MKKYQYVCMFDEPKHARPFKNCLAASKAAFTNLEDEGQTISLVGADEMLALIEEYKLPEEITLQVERRPAGSEPEDAEADATLESFAYYGVE